MRHRLGARQFIGHQPNVATNNPTVLLDLIDDAAHQVNRNCEADAFGADALGKHRRVDADQLTTLALIRAPPELPSLIAASVWMKVLEGHQAEQAATGCADNALGDRFGQAKRVADREYDVTSAQICWSDPAGSRAGSPSSTFSTAISVSASKPT